MTVFRTLRASTWIALLVLGYPAETGLAQTNRAAVPARELIRISAEDANLSSIALLAVSEQGVLAVAQRRDGHVRLFAPDGKPITTIGRPGAGPWEFRRLDAMGWVGDTLWIADQALKRITTFHASGTSGAITELPLQLTARSITNLRFMFPSVTARLPDGSLLVQAAALPVPEDPERNPAMNDAQWSLRVSADGIVQRVISKDPPDTCRRAKGDVVMALPMSICPRKVVATRPDGSRRVLLTTATTARDVGAYRVVAVNASGDTLYNRTYSVPLTPIPAPSRDSLLRGARESGGLMGASDIPRYYAPLHDAHLLPDGGVWIALTSGQDALREWQRLDPRGSRLASVWIPRAAKVMALEPRGAWALVTDVDGFQNVVLYATPRS